MTTVKSILGNEVFALLAEIENSHEAFDAKETELSGRAKVDVTLTVRASLDFDFDINVVRNALLKIVEEDGNYRIVPNKPVRGRDRSDLEELVREQFDSWLTNNLDVLVNGESAWDVDVDEIDVDDVEFDDEDEVARITGEGDVSDPAPVETAQPQVTSPPKVALALSDQEIEVIKEVLSGDRKGLYAAFIWASSPQGHNYWQQFHPIGDDRPLTPEARAILERAVETGWIY